jgi:iron complex transport system substrate-binding protein
MRLFKRAASALFVVFGFILVPLASGPPSGAASTSGFPITIKAADGTFTLSSRPTSIVSLSPTSTEILFAIGAGQQVTAVDSYSDYPPNAPITKLSGYTPNVEAIAKYKPDLVVVASDPAGFNTQMAALKIPVLYFSAAANLKQAYAQYVTLGKATGHVAQAKTEVANVKTKIASIIASTPRAPKGTTYYYELDPTYYSVTSTTFVGQLFALLGLKSIADSAKGVAASGGYPQLNAEFILKANPSYVFLADTLCCKATASTVAARPGWSAMSAVKKNRVIPLNDDIASRWGPRVTILLQDIADALKGVKVSTAS